MNLSIPSHLTNDQLDTVKKVQRANTLPYYKESVALTTKGIIDKVHAANAVVRVPAENLSVNTLRVQYYQGAKYLIDNLDPDGVYKALYARTRCMVFDGYLEFHPRKGKGTLTTGTVVIPWREDFVLFIENAKANDKFYRDNLCLTAEDIAWINAQVAPLVKTGPNGEELPWFFGEITKDRILMIRDI